MITDEVKRKVEMYFKNACKTLNIEFSNYIYVYEPIGSRFATSCNSAEFSGNVLYINEDWIKIAIDNDDEYDLEFVMAHEARHQYQQFVINDFYTRGRSCELPSIINSWIESFQVYKRNEGDELSEIANANQAVEIDANAFAAAYMMIQQNKGARIPPSCAEDVVKRMKEIAFKIWKARFDD